jgi:cell division septation protein DedD
VPEEPVAKPPKVQSPPAPKPGFSAEATAPAKPEPVLEPRPPSVPRGSVIQLGAFANQAQAERAWTALSSRFPSIGSMGKLIIPFSGGIRLRATAESPAEAKQACQRLKAAGENCFVAQ